MAEIIGIIASIIGLCTFIWGIIRYVAKPIFVKREKLNDIINLVDEHYERWVQFGYLARAESLIIGSEFMKLDKYRNELKDIDKDKLGFLLRCAIQNGMKGNWGKWLCLQNSVKSFIPVLVSTLDGNSGLRPCWRSSYILEKLFKSDVDNIKKQIPKSIINNNNVNQILKIISNEGIVNYLIEISKKSNSKNKIKAKLVLQEIDFFRTDIENFLIKHN